MQDCTERAGPWRLPSSLGYLPQPGQASEILIVTDVHMKRYIGRGRINKGVQNLWFHVPSHDLLKVCWPQTFPMPCPMSLPAVNQHAPSLWSFVYVVDSILNARCSFNPKFNASYSCEVEVVIVLYGKAHGFLVWTHPSLMHIVDRTPKCLVLWEILWGRVDLTYFSI